MWFIVGIVLGALLFGMFIQIRNKNIKLTWYELSIGFIGLSLFLYTVQNFVGSFLEHETQAAWMFLLVTGLPSIILLAVAYQLVTRHNRANG